MEQIKRWREGGYHVLLQNAHNGWVLVVDTEPIYMFDRSGHAGEAREMLRYVSPVCASPEECIAAALRRLREAPLTPKEEPAP